MWLNKVFTILLLVSVAACTHAAGDKSQGEALLQTVTGFYGWVLENGKDAQRFEPRITHMPGSTHLYLDQSTLGQYSDALISSGYFAPEFRSNVAGFYARSAHELSKYSQREFDEMARDGRGPLIDSEDIDVFFCSQEAEYTSDYVAGTRLQQLRINGETATAVIVTTDQWKTNFSFRKIDGIWRISGYCLYKVSP
jgi:hypothetical protein